MAEIQEQTQLANEVSEAISTNTYTDYNLNDVRNSPVGLAGYTTHADHTHALRIRHTG